MADDPARPGCSPSVDGSFGPIVDDCVRTFDFTLLFEESILSILPSSIFLILAFLRIGVLSGRKRRVGGHVFSTVKLVVFGILLILSSALLALWSSGGRSTYRTRTSVPAAVLSMVECLVFMTLSFLEHGKTAGSSLLLDAYLIITILFDAVRVRTLWLNNTQSSIAGLFTTCMLVKIVALILEESNKRRWLLPSSMPWSKEVTGGVFSRTLFAWLDRLMCAGYSKALSVATLPDIDAKLLSQSLWDRVGPEIHEAKKEKRSLLLTIFWSLKGPLLAPVLPYCILVASQLAQPFLISTILDYVASSYDGSQDSKNIGYGLIGAYGLVYLCIAIATAWGQHFSYRFVVMLRGILVTAIYRKTMSATLATASDASAITLMSTDVERIVLGMAKIHDAWSTLVQVACAMYILYRQVGAVFVAPIVLSIVCTFLSLVLSSFAGTFQVKWMAALEKRVAVTSSLLGSIKGVKMLGWSRKAVEILQNLRLQEIASARSFRLMLLGVVTVSFIPVTLAPVAIFGIFARNADQTGLNSSHIFTTLSLLSLITQPLDLLFSYVPEIIAGMACFSRIQNYVYDDGLSERPVVPETNSEKSPAPKSNKDASTSSDSDDGNEKILGDGAAIEMQSASFGWDAKTDPLLQNLDLKIASDRLTMITGPIASGKTTLLKGILGETPVCRGTVKLSTHSIAFCDQNPWLANETLRANILGTSHFEAARYNKVVDACALKQDIQQFSQGDQVNIGSNGLSLSGGQKQRVAIARAIYSKRKIAIFDDVFSGLDMETQSHIVREVFGPNGLLKSQGTTAILVTHAAHLLVHADEIVALNSENRIVKQGPPQQLGGEETLAALLEGVDAITKEPSSAVIHKHEPDSGPSQPVSAPLESSVDEETQRLGDGTVYKYYFSTFGWPKTILFFALQITLVFCLKFPEIILSWWGEDNDREPNVHNSKWLGIFAALEVAALAALVLVCWHVLLNLAVISGSKLHYTLLRCTMRAPLSFFGVTDTGSITNRFSQDMNLIDAELPFSLINFVCNGLTCIAQAVMIIPASVWLLIGYPILFGGLWLLQRFYLRTSRQLRFLDLEAKSPIYSQFLETLNGLATVRAFGWQEDLIAKADERLDFSQKPFYLLYSIQRWLNLVLDLIVACLAVVLIAVAVALRNSSSVGFAGVALFNIMNLSAALKSAITSWTMLETSIGAVARVKRYEESTPDENLASEDLQPPDAWPSTGTIVFDNVTASYKDDDDQTAISNVSLRINGGEKVGICGRSGSGKSSTLLALLHLINSRGAITIDGLDTSRIPRETLRERLTTVPQDPVSFAGNVRLNTDPQGKISDESIVEALQAVKLWDVVEAKGGLDAEVNEELFSKGQQQLFSLSRALLNHSRIVIMDEASSSLDEESENLMISLVRDRFKDATVLCVAHRLDTIMDFDRVLVLDKGGIIEEGNPRELLARPSAFKTLYES